MCHHLYISALIDGYGRVYIAFNLMHWNIRPKLCHQEKEGFMSDNIRILWYFYNVLQWYIGKAHSNLSLSLSPLFAWAIKPIRFKIMITKWKKEYIYIYIYILFHYIFSQLVKVVSCKWLTITNIFSMNYNL